MLINFIENFVEYSFKNYVICFFILFILTNSLKYTIIIKKKLKMKGFFLYSRNFRLLRKKSSVEDNYPKYNGGFMAKVRDFTSGLTHCIGAVLALIGMVILIVFSAIWGDGYDVVSFTIFGIGLFLLYLFSTLYHWLNISQKGINVFRKFDHIMIYILIASSYTPICLGPLRGPWGWSIFGILWGFALLGTILSAIWIKAPRALTTTIYLIMGWMGIVAIYPIVTTLKDANLLNGIWWLVACGVFYTIGGIIYWLKLPKTKWKDFGFHEIFHIFVMLGSASHYWFVLRYVLKM